MLLPFSDPANGVPEPPGDFKSNYRYLKKLINRALKEGTPIEELHLIPRQPSPERARELSREDLIKLHFIRRIALNHSGEISSRLAEDWLMRIL